VAGEVHSRPPPPPRISHKTREGERGRGYPKMRDSPRPPHRAPRQKRAPDIEEGKGGAGVREVHSRHRPPIPWGGGKRGTRPKACAAPHPREGRWRERVSLLRRRLQKRKRQKGGREQPARGGGWTGSNAGDQIPVHPPCNASVRTPAGVLVGRAR